MRIQGGFTLLELLTTLTVAAVSLALLIPMLGPAMERNAVIADTRSLQHLVRLSRQTALTESVRVIICPLDRQQKCTRDWSAQLAAFVDPDNDKRLSEHERAIYYWSPHRAHTLRWSGFGSGYLRISNNGFAAENGSFTICPGSGDVRSARQLIVNRVGRSYVSRDQDGDGIVEYGRNQEPGC